MRHVPVVAVSGKLVTAASNAVCVCSRQRALGDVHSLRVLMLQHNHLQGLPDTVGHLQSLKVLPLLCCRLHACSETLRQE